MRFQGVTFKNERVRLDGREFRDCTFENALLEYAGGPLSLDGCSFTGAISWRFDGDFGRGLAAIGRLYEGQPAVGLRTVVDSMFPKRDRVARPAAAFRKAA